MGSAGGDSDRTPTPEGLDRLNGYPGRGVIAFTDRAGSVGWVYFVTGRSQSSLERSPERDGTQLLVSSTSSAAGHDALRHYACAVPIDGGGLVVGNGDHVEHIAGGLGEGRHLAEVLDDIEPEPDPPLNTPRIGLVFRDGSVSQVLVELGDGKTVRESHPIEPRPGFVEVLHTYGGQPTDPTGVAQRFSAAVDDPDALAEELWDILDPRFRVLLCAGTAKSPEPVTTITR